MRRLCGLQRTALPLGRLTHSPGPALAWAGPSEIQAGLPGLFHAPGMELGERATSYLQERPDVGSRRDRGSERRLEAFLALLAGCLVLRFRVPGVLGPALAEMDGNSILRGRPILPDRL